MVRVLSDAILINGIKSSEQIWMDGPPFSFSGFSQAVMNFGGATKVFRVCLPHPKPKLWPNFRKEFQVGSRFGERKPGWRPWERLSWHPVATHSHWALLFVFSWVLNSHPFSQVNRLISLHNGHIKTLNVVSVNVSSVAAALHLFQSSGRGFFPSSR